MREEEFPRKIIHEKKFRAKQDSTPQSHGNYNWNMGFS
jgi:hypothetical protein